METFFAQNNQEQILNRIFSLNLNLLCILNIEGQFFKINPAWEKTFGYNPKVLLNTYFADYAHPDDRDATVFVFRKMLKESHRLTFANRFKAKNRRFRCIEWEFNHHGDYIYVSGTDITDDRGLNKCHSKNAPVLHSQHNLSHHHDRNYPQLFHGGYPVKQTIHIVDDSVFNTKVLEDALREDYNLVISHNGKNALEHLQSAVQPDLILLDIVLPDFSGYEICRILKESPITKDIPVLFLSSLDETKDIKIGLDLGAIDYITKPFSIPVIKAKIRNHMIKKHEWDNLILHTDLDPLTEIGNRRYFDQMFETEIERAKRIRSVLSILLVDIDHFKYYNDTYGHLEGDRCLKIVADSLSENLTGDGDCIARWGGEEFACLLPDTKSSDAQSIAEQLRLAIISQAIPHMASPIEDVVTVSIGVVTSDQNNDESFDILLQRADEALYEAKKSGRNQYSVWRDDIIYENVYI